MVSCLFIVAVYLNIHMHDHLGFTQSDNKNPITIMFKLADGWSYVSIGDLPERIGGTEKWYKVGSCKNGNKILGIYEVDKL